MKKKNLPVDVDTPEESMCHESSVMTHDTMGTRSRTTWRRRRATLTLLPFFSSPVAADKLLMPPSRPVFNSPPKNQTSLLSLSSLSPVLHPPTLSATKIKATGVSAWGPPPGPHHPVRHDQRHPNPTQAPRRHPRELSSARRRRRARARLPLLRLPSKRTCM